jgi:gamma-glutamyl-gamma-aminobutyrate hydrolase PuuD
MKPVIGITSSFETSGKPPRSRSYLNAAYTDAIFAAGGVPQPLPVPPHPDTALLDELLARCDALLFTGGPDLDPRHYGQPRHPRTQVLDPRRDNFELEAFRCADQRGLPILAICLGCQVASVARGGCLVQHVDDLPRTPAVVHHHPDGSSAFHDVRIEPDSHLARIVGRTQFEVNSRHHQFVDRAHVGGHLRPVAFAPDGVVEAAEEVGDRFLVAVQWHPEDLIDRPEHLRLFEALVAAARAAHRAAHRFVDLIE